MAFGATCRRTETLSVSGSAHRNGQQRVAASSTRSSDEEESAEDALSAGRAVSFWSTSSSSCSNPDVVFLGLWAPSPGAAGEDDPGAASEVEVAKARHTAHAGGAGRADGARWSSVRACLSILAIAGGEDEREVREIALRLEQFTATSSKA